MPVVPGAVELDADTVRQRDEGVHDDDALADLVHRPDQRPGIVRRQVIEQARADDDVEHAVLGDRQVANVVLVEHGAAEAERVTREVALGDARGAAFDADDLAAVRGELEGVVPLEAGQVQDPALRQRLADDVAADLQDALEAVIDRGLARVGAAGQLDRHRRPGTVLIDDVLEVTFQILHWRSFHGHANAACAIDHSRSAASRRYRQGRCQLDLLEADHRADVVDSRHLHQAVGEEVAERLEVRGRRPSAGSRPRPRRCSTRGSAGRRGSRPRSRAPGRSRRRRC